MTEESDDTVAFPKYQPNEINIKDYVEKLRNLRYEAAEKKLRDAQNEKKVKTNKVEEYVLVKNEGVAMRAFSCWKCNTILNVKEEAYIVKCDNCNRLNNLPVRKEIVLDNKQPKGQHFPDIKMPHLFLLIKCPICSVDNKIRKDKTKFVCTNCENISIVEKLEQDSSFPNIENKVIINPQTGNYQWKATAVDPKVNNMILAKIPEGGSSPNANTLKNSRSEDTVVKDVFLRSPDFYQKAYINPISKVYHPSKYSPQNVINPFLGEKNIHGFYDPLRYRILIEDQLYKNNKVKKREFGVMLEEKRIQDIIVDKSLKNINDYLANYDVDKYTKKQKLLKEYENRKNIRDYYDNQYYNQRSLENNFNYISSPNFNQLSYIKERPFNDYKDNIKSVPRLNNRKSILNLGL